MRRKEKNQRQWIFNVWRSYSDMMAGVATAFCADHVCDSFPGAEKL